jgi:hypothetical protein
LDSADLPRPGFFGGEIYAVENFIYAALDSAEESEPHLAEEESLAFSLSYMCREGWRLTLYYIFG